MKSKLEKTRCEWCGADSLYVKYHDMEWGVPVGLKKQNDYKLFEFLILEGAQAGLSWITVLRKRENYREVFANFDPQKVARFTDQKIQKILQNPGIIRNKLKVRSAIKNAQAFLKVQEEFGSFSKYQWRFVDGKPIQNHRKSIKELPARTVISDQFSKDLKQRGFSFVGSTIIYAHMQAVGMVNDHTVHCYRYNELS